MNELKPEDVMKALEHCANYKRAEVSCIGCPLYGKCDVNTLESLALALLREKDAEIERLKGDFEKAQCSVELLGAELGKLGLALSQVEQIARADAITEYAERLKEKKLFLKDHAGNMGIVVRLSEIYKIAKEMKEDLS